jgi:AcrR family transcriptional regulator
VDSVKKEVRLSYRQQQALATRAHIVDVARALFQAQGYATTPIEAIAVEAGVAVSTIYAIFRNKRSILAAICEAWLEAAEIRTLLETSLAEPDARRRLRIAARWTRQQWERGSEIVPLLNLAARTDADAAAMLAEWVAEKSQAMGEFVASLEGALRPGLSVALAGDLFDALTIPELYSDLVERSGWSADAYEAWLAETLAQQLLAEPTP